ncbi:alpha/beta fold hydrolase [Nonomuraea endophytica]|uniref:Pimeloyl-ACP methyl ester carboxylesterase n=1 Tax=Nonomuraea endophytica TaxID=714136 RepID=A0A7W8A8Q0_9ACTN|nr:alpha/beta fold hydrolase [Nonomuraea endophytica]MBB5080750.1 pimeloyl-ACP methyl ester carboxylesterase [Nonomuraea endophytica]
MKRVAAVLAALAVGTGTLTGVSHADSLGRFYGQEVTWTACGDTALDQAGAQCAQVEVPLDYSAPRGRTLKVAISRIKASDTARRRGIMLSNPGGPGGAGLHFMLYVRGGLTPEVASRYDLIGMDPRGVGRSAAIDCDWPVGHMLWSAGLTRRDFRAAVRTQEDLARRCEQKEGDRIAHITTRNTARDMDVIRGALGEAKTSYLGFSYGTYLGAVYTQMFPRRADRFVLDSAVDPASYMAGSIKKQGPVNEAALDDWAAWTAARDADYSLGTTRARVRARVEGLVRQAARSPIRIGTHLLDARFLPMTLFTLLQDARYNAHLAARVRQIADAAEGKPVQPSADFDQELRLHLNGEPQDLSSQGAVICGDTAAPRNPERYWRDIRRSRATQPVFGAYANNITACAFWRAPLEPRTVVRNDVPALIVQATQDTRTVYQEGVALRRAMPGSRLVTLQDVRMHGILGRLRNACVEEAVNTYFRDGVLPAADLTCRA